MLEIKDMKAWLLELPIKSYFSDFTSLKDLFYVPFAIYSLKESVKGTLTSSSIRNPMNKVL